MELRHKPQHREQENAGSNPRAVESKRKADAGSSDDRKPHPRPRRGLQLPSPQPPPTAVAALPGAAAVDRSLLAPTEGGAQVALPQLAGIEAQAPQQPTAEQNGTATAAPTSAPAVPPAAAPISDEASWLAAMQLSPLVNLLQLRPGLGATGHGWLAGLGTPRLPSGAHTPPSLVQVLLGAPLSQHKGLPSPVFLDFGEPAVPRKQGTWSCQHPPPAKRGPAAAAAPPPQQIIDASTASSAAPHVPPVAIPIVVMRLPLEPSAAGPAAAADMVMVPVQSTVLTAASPMATTVPPAAAAPGAVAFKLPQAPAFTAAAAAAFRLPAAAPVAAVAVPAPPAVPQEPAAGPAAAAARVAAKPPTSAVAAGAPEAQHKPSPASQGRSRRTRRQRVQDSEYEWWSNGGADAGGAVAGTDSNDDMPTDNDSDSEGPASSGPAKSSSKAEGSGSKAGSSGSKAGSSGSKARRGGSGAGSILQQQLQQEGLQRRMHALLHLSAPQAQARMGCSYTTFRALCRAVGIKRWPSRR